MERGYNRFVTAAVTIGADKTGTLKFKSTRTDRRFVFDRINMVAISTATGAEVQWKVMIKRIRLKHVGGKGDFVDIMEGDEVPKELIAGRDNALPGLLRAMQDVVEPVEMEIELHNTHTDEVAVYGVLFGAEEKGKIPPTVQTLHQPV